MTSQVALAWTRHRGRDRIRRMIDPAARRMVARPTIIIFSNYEVLVKSKPIYDLYFEVAVRLPADGICEHEGSCTVTLLVMALPVSAAATSI
jgi:hypothetical protein